MEKHFLDDWIHKLDKSATLGSDKKKLEPWYNPHGDCIEFQTTHEAIVADRIDNYLTIYRSANTKKPIGFQIKEVHALLDKYKYEVVSLEAEIRGEELVSVTALLMFALGSDQVNIGRREGYVLAMKSFIKDKDKDAVALSA